MKYWFVIVILLFGISLFSQEEEDDYDVKPLLSDSVNISGFGCPLLIVSNYKDNTAFYFGGAGGLIIDDRYFIGGFGNGMTSNFEISSGEYQDDKFEVGIGGIWLGYIYKGKKMFHPEVSVMIGWGSLSISDKSARYNPDSYDSFSIITPSLELCYTPWNFLRIGIGVSYSKFNNLSFSEITDDDFSGPGGYFTVKLGWF